MAAEAVAAKFDTDCYPCIRTLDELDAWATLGVEGHFLGRHPWMPYHELLTEQTARLVGAHPLEVVVMNTLSVNLHLMMVSFYRPTRERPAILVEAGSFPSDRYAVASQVAFHGFDPHGPFTFAIGRFPPRFNNRPGAGTPSR
mgnify:CR=1 FL=1